MQYRRSGRLSCRGHPSGLLLLDQVSEHIHRLLLLHRSVFRSRLLGDLQAAPARAVLRGAGNLGDKGSCGVA